MFLHNVYFWMESSLDEGALEAFERGLETLCKNSPVKLGYFGKPPESHRDVVDGSFGYGLHLVFDDKAGHDAYQVGDVHQRFIAAHASKWTRVQVYDTETA